MKKSLFAIAAVCLISATAAQAQDARFSLKPQPRATTGNFVKQAPTTAEGVVPRAVRSGNPLQAINPFAPAAYGNGQDAVRREDSDPYQRPQGIKLLSLEF